MKEIAAIIRPGQWPLLKKQLVEAGFSAWSSVRVLGRGRQQGVRYLTGPQKQPGRFFVGCAVPVGRLGSQDALEIARVAEAYGEGEVRLTASQNFILPHIPASRLEQLRQEPLLARFPPNPSRLLRGLVSCTGIDYCNLALIETKELALWVARSLEDRLGELPRPLTIRWSGCPAGCGNHHSADIGLQGLKARVGNQVVDAVQIFVGGRSGKQPRRAQKIMHLVPCDQTLLDVLETIVRHFDILSRVEPEPKGEQVLMIPVRQEGAQIPT